MGTCLHLSTVHRHDDTRIWRLYVLTSRERGEEVELAVPVPHHVCVPSFVHPLPVFTNRFLRFLGGNLAALHCIWRLKHVTKIHFHDPELLFLALLLQWMGYEVTYDVHEDYPKAILHKQYLPEWLRSTLSVGMDYLELAISEQLSQVVAATPSIAARFHHAEVVENRPDLAIIQAIPPARTKDTRVTTYVYHGILSEERGLWEMLDYILLKAQEKPVRGLLIGQCYPATVLQHVQQHPAWPYIEFFPWLPYEETIALVKSADFGLLLFRDLPNHRMSQPNKLFEYQACGLPIVATRFPHWETLLHNWPTEWIEV